jgi:hypothetical protein|tara:strand:- start:3582 stop:4328 length:747 start_codon:yes stop_codon:yes gene_type:complete
MAIRTIALTDTLETFRTEFNNMTSLDFGDAATLAGAGLSSTTVVGAVIELAGVVAAASGFYINDGTTSQLIGAGQTINLASSSNINAVVSATDTLTLNLTDSISVSGTSHTFGNITVANGSITDSSGSISFGNENLSTSGSLNITGLTTLASATMSGIQLTTNGTIIFEGSSNDDNETTLTVTNPTADRTITIPNETGTLITSNGIDVISESMMADQAISSVQMKTLSTLQILNSAGTVVKTIHGAGV